jgi:hypothetical protein
MRIFCAISSWVLWLIYASELGEFLFYRVGDAMPWRRIDQVHQDLRPFWIVFVVSSLLALSLWILRRRFWFQRRQSPGFGFWGVTLLFYCSAIVAILAGFMPYVAAFYRGKIEWLASIVGITLCYLGYPRLPRQAPSENTP